VIATAALAAALRFAVPGAAGAWASAWLLQAADRGARNIESPRLWIGFLCGVFVLLFIDLRATARRGRAHTFKEALAWSLFWVAVSLAFGGFLWASYGGEQGLEFFAGYMLEKSLSVDNLFVFVLLFQAMRIPADQQHRVLFWGVLGALVLRGTLILTGVALVHHYHWIMTIFGAILVATALKLVFVREQGEEAPVDSWLVRKVKQHLRITAELEGPLFFVRRNGHLFATPLFLAVVAAESADLVFALDSIPAVFAVTDDSFLVFSSNVCALLGLRALYFVVAGALVKVRYLKPGLAAILLFVGVKMIVDRWWSVPTGTSILVIGGILGVSLLVSALLREGRGEPRGQP
jgi:tellurite resistance protein TerC